MTPHRNAQEYDKLIAEGRKARQQGKPIHANPYDYRFETVAANAWDDGWNGGAA